jgi:DNA-binding transcriptional regulator YiaG
MKTVTHSVGDNVRAARGPLSHDKFAALLGTTRQVVIGWEKGKHVPGARHRARLAQVSGQPVAAFTRDGKGDDDKESE